MPLAKQATCSPPRRTSPMSCCSSFPERIQQGLDAGYGECLLARPDVLHSWKSFTAKEINKLLVRQRSRLLDQKPAPEFRADRVDPLGRQLPLDLVRLSRLH